VTVSHLMLPQSTTGAHSSSSSSSSRCRTTNEEETQSQSESESESELLSLTEQILHWASIGDLESLKGQEHSVVSHSVDRHQSTVLHYAAGNGQLHVCRYLFEHSLVSVTATSSNNGRTALHWAARNGHADICHALVMELELTLELTLAEHPYGATPVNVNVDVEAKGQVTPLQLAIWQCHIEVAKLLVDLGASPTYINHWGCGVAHWLGKCPLYANTKASASASANNAPTPQDKDDPSQQEQVREVGVVVVREVVREVVGVPVEEQQRLVQCCEWLFGECAIPYNSPNHHGQTPLHKAGFGGNWPVLRYLVEQRGVVDDTRDAQGNTAADCAERAKHYETAQWLRRHASPLVRTAMQQLGFTPVATIAVAATTSASTPPPLQDLRIAFCRLAKSCHPDRLAVGHCRSEQETQQAHQHHQQQQQPPPPPPPPTWNQVRDAYRLLVDWWEAPDQCDWQIRIQSRNAALMEHPQLLWRDDWHDEQKQQKQQQQQQKQQQQQQKQKQSPNRPKQGMDFAALAHFETRLLRLLATDAFRTHGLSLSQLPKEYEKNWHTPIPKPRDFGCRTLVYLLEHHCSTNILIERNNNNNNKGTTRTQQAVVRARALVPEAG
jgi:ankyrin repeat protein